MTEYTIYDCHLNGDTKNYGGLEWIVNGERGRISYPGTIPKCYAKRMYAEGVNKIVNVGYCDGCIGADEHDYCRMKKQGV